MHSMKDDKSGDFFRLSSHDILCICKLKHRILQYISISAGKVFCEHLICRKYITIRRYITGRLNTQKKIDLHNNIMISKF